MSDRDSTIECYYNVYKSLYGVRPKFIDFDSMTDQEVDKAMARLSLDNDKYWATQA